MKALRAILVFIARLCLAAVFLFSGVSKFILFDQNAQYMASKGLPNAPLLLMAAAIVEVLCSLLIIFGYKARFGALVLLIYLIPVTYLFHNFWNLEDGERTMQQIMFLKNLAIFGGLLYLLCDGPGGFACDALGRKKHQEIKPQVQEPKISEQRPPEHV